MTNRTNLKNVRNNFKMQSESMESKGNKPIPEAASVSEVFVLMIMHLCRKSLFFDTHLKIAIYLGALFLLSLIADVMNFPKTYLSRTDNIFNQYFVKIGWFWLLLLTIPYVVLTSYTICCGKRRTMMTSHLSRLIVATFFWYMWTTLFNVVETNYGKCNTRSFDTKTSCLKNGHFWNGFDISGHCFILIYSSLILIEEARAINGWDKIKHYIRDEEYYRTNEEKTLNMNPLKNMSNEELAILKKSYQKFTPYVRGLFITICCLQILWDVMLVSTILYYHIMVEKFLSGIIAVLTWFITYRVWYRIPNIFPNLPGDGIFKYNKEKNVNTPTVHRKRTSTTNGKHFMGIPIYKTQDSLENEEPR